MTLPCHDVNSPQTESKDSVSVLWKPSLFVFLSLFLAKNWQAHSKNMYGIQKARNNLNNLSNKKTVFEDSRYLISVFIVKAYFIT